MAYGSLDSNWQVDGTTIYAPQTNVGIAHNSLQSSDSGRTEDGMMHIDWVRTDIKTISLTWPELTGTQVAFLLGLIQGKEITLTYQDNGTQTMDCYCSKTSYSLHSTELDSSEGGYYKDFKADFIEM